MQLIFQGILETFSFVFAPGFGCKKFLKSPENLAAPESLLPKIPTLSPHPYPRLETCASSAPLCTCAAQRLCVHDTCNP